MQRVTQQPNKRIEYIDALRGFTMILVVFSHIEWFSLQFQSSFVNEVFVSFRMPLFFFISGFIGYKANIDWTLGTWWVMSKKKMMIQLVPTIFFGYIFTCIYNNTDFTSFITNSGKLGYWFTFVLLEMFLLLYSMNLILYICGVHRSRTIRMVALGGLTLVLSAMILVPKYLPSLQSTFEILSLHNTIKYFPFFAFGYVCSMYKDMFHRLTENKHLITIVILMFSSLFYTKYKYLTPNVGSGTIIFLTEIIVEMIVGILGLVIVYNTFRHYSTAFTSDKRIGFALQQIGRRTLDIYLLHYFFLPHLPELGRIMASGNNSALELIIGIGLSLAVIGICMLTSCILRTSPILGKYLFGAK